MIVTETCKHPWRRLTLGRCDECRCRYLAANPEAPRLVKGSGAPGRPDRPARYFLGDGETAIALPSTLPRPRASGRLPVPRPSAGRAPVRVTRDPVWDQLVAAAGFVSP